MVTQNRAIAAPKLVHQHDVALLKTVGTPHTTSGFSNIIVQAEFFCLIPSDSFCFAAAFVNIMQ
jgi:hypothetical protein